MVTDADHSRRINDPRRAHPRHAVVDEASAAVLDEATMTLTLLRAPMRLGDHLAELHALVSLRAQIDARLPTVVVAARDQGHRWTDIAGQLAMTPDGARRRYRTRITTDENTR